MKKLYTLALLLFTFTAFAQPTITAAWVPNVGLQTRIYGYYGSFGLSEGNAGANQTWDFTSNDTTGSQVVHYISPSSAPGGSGFAGATDCAEGISTGGNTAYTFDKLNGNVYQLIGASEPSNSNYTTTYTDPQDILHFPATYNSAFTDVARLTGSFSGGGGSGTIRGTTNESVTADAYGTLTTAAGTFGNVLRFKIVQDILDTEAVSGQTVDLTYHYETYIWLSPAIKGVILASISHLTSSQTGTSDAGYYSQVTSTGIADLASAGITAWAIAPQPATEAATIIMQSDKDGSTAEITMHDMTGRLAYQTAKVLSAGKNNIAINVAGMATGVYTVSINIAGRTDTQKVVVSH